MISFAEKHPELVQEWSDENEARPEEVSYGSNKRILWRASCGHSWEATVKNRGNGSGCPFCSGNQVLYGFNDLASVYPELAAEWSELNYPLYPSAVTVRANRKVWWKCKTCGQHWQARIADRTEGHGCPVCAGERLIPGVNDFATEYPLLAEEWSEKNLDLKPSMVWSKSRRNVWWKCKTCGYEWRGVIDSRVKGQKCPACEDRAVRPGHNDLETLYPELASEWDMDRNGVITPNMFTSKSRKFVFWRCGKGHLWKDRISDGADGAGCPVCEEIHDEEMKHNSIRFYAKRAEVEFYENDEEPIGIPIQFYFPNQKLAIEFYENRKPTKAQKNWEVAKNWLCLNSGIRLVRILSPDTEEFDNCICITRVDHGDDVLGEAINAAFRIGGICVDVDYRRDKDFIKNI